jgi:hypothetical protein
MQPLGLDDYDLIQYDSMLVFPPTLNSCVLTSLIWVSLFLMEAELKFPLGSHCLSFITLHYNFLKQLVHPFLVIFIAFLTLLKLVCLFGFGWEKIICIPWWIKMK